MNILAKKKRNGSYYIDTSKKTALYELKTALSEMLLEARAFYKEIIILCIGTDRATGDSLGPLIGYKLKKLNLEDKAMVYGTLSDPVHAKNLNNTVKKIYETHENPFVIAIDASLGNTKHIGYITMGKGSIKPGAGVKKDLDAVGDMFITGIVNFSSLMDMSILQNTRLSIVMEMADIVAAGLWLSL